MKKGIGKRIRRFFVATLIVLLSLLAILLFFRDDLIEFAMEKAGSAILGTQIEVADFSSSLAGRVEITGLTVANPPGYEAPYAFRLDRIAVDVDLLSLFTKRILVNEIIVCGLALNFEQVLTSNNLGEIQDNIRAGKKEEAEAVETEEEEGNDDAKTAVEITLFDVSDTAISFSSSTLRQTVVLPLGGVTFRDIGKQSSISPTEALDFVYEQIFLAVLSKCRDVGGVLLENGSAAAQDLLESSGNATQKTLDVAGDSAQKAVEGIAGAAKNLIDGAGNGVNGSVEKAGKAASDALKELKLW
ncbi:MAG: hypothetical protein MJ016_07465 [Victivallaceae bacterium]|nr:hypothetical protein [Victivallaceae bacterium]